MPKHVQHPFHIYESCCEPDPAGKTSEEPDFGWANSIDQTTCHRCLDYLIRQGEAAVARVVALDLIAGQTGKSNK